jgi:hypothetical protein
MAFSPHTLNGFGQHIRTRLAILKDAFFPALRTGDDALLSFQASWSSFNDLLQTCHDQLDDETHTLVFSFADMVDTVSSALLEVDTVGNSIEKELEAEISRIAAEDLRNLSIHDSMPTITRKFLASNTNLLFNKYLFAQSRHRILHTSNLHASGY